MSDDNAVRDLLKLAARLEAVKPLDKVKPSMEKAALKIKNQGNRDFKASKWFKGAGNSVSYEWITDTSSVIEVEVGAEGGSGNPGAIANIAYFGASRGGGGTVQPIEDVAADEFGGSKFDEFIGKAVDNIFKGVL